MSGEFKASTLAELREHLPSVAGGLDDVLATLERRAQDMCDVEFTVESGRLWVLQTRIGQRSSRAALRTAVDMADEGLISRAEAVRRAEERGVDAVAMPAFAGEPPAHLLVARGVASSPGAVTGVAAYAPGRAQGLADTGECVVLVRPTTSPADLPGPLASVGVVTGRGGPMSHAAVVARGLDRSAVCGVGFVIVGADLRSATLAGREVREGELLSVDGDRGLVARGALDISPADDNPAYRQFLEWCGSAVNA